MSGFLPILCFEVWTVKEMAVQAFSRKQLNPYGRRYAATLITSFVLG